MTDCALQAPLTSPASENSGLNYLGGGSAMDPLMSLIEDNPLARKPPQNAVLPSSSSNDHRRLTTTVRRVLFDNARHVPRRSLISRNSYNGLYEFRTLVTREVRPDGCVAICIKSNSSVFCSAAIQRRRRSLQMMATTEGSPPWCGECFGFFLCKRKYILD
jgi:hypothetical protein